MRPFFLLLLFAFLFSCTNNAGEKNKADTSKIVSHPDTAKATETEAVDKNQFYIWEVDSERKTKTKNPQLRPEYYNVDTLIMGLNAKYPNIRLEKTDIGHDTLYTKIQDAQYLTEQMGSAGSEQYIAQAVVNLTSVKGVNYVRIDFEEGSHASPDVWSNSSFGDYREVKE
jgi:anionic cell wall polymer biosynthesis LytR-Cps2A-Psr (LCP) family protein